jgi:hypothetical protein
MEFLAPIMVAKLTAGTVQVLRDSQCLEDREKVICRLFRQAPEKKSDKISFSTSGITSLSLAIE